MSVINTRSFSQFWPVLWDITHCFWVPKRFTLLLNPKVRLRVGHQHSHFLADSGSFCDNSSFRLFWPDSWTITHCFGVPE